MRHSSADVFLRRTLRRRSREQPRTKDAVSMNRITLDSKLSQVRGFSNQRKLQPPIVRKRVTICHNTPQPSSKIEVGPQFRPPAPRIRQAGASACNPTSGFGTKYRTRLACSQAGINSTASAWPNLRLESDKDVETLIHTLPPP